MRINLSRVFRPQARSQTHTCSNCGLAPSTSTFSLAIGVVKKREINGKIRKTTSVSFSPMEPIERFKRRPGLTIQN
jgi:hypothetical protein